MMRKVHVLQQSTTNIYFFDEQKKIRYVMNISLKKKHIHEDV